jgi:putative transposase
MSRLRRLALTGRIFFVTCNVAKGVRPLSPSERNLFLGIFEARRQRLGFRLFAYVVMPTHWHGLILPAHEQTISDIIHSVKRTSAVELNQRRRTTGAFWQRRFFDSFMRKVRDYHDTIEYIHTNPVRDGLVSHAAQWPWSSFRQFLGRVNPKLVADVLELPLDPEYRL